MIKFFYKRIIKKLNLSRDQLEELKSKLSPDNICAGPFIFEGKMCPTTTALALKIHCSEFTDASKVRAQFRSFGINRADLLFLYIVFDFPSMFSERFFRYSLEQMKYAVDIIT